MLGDEWGMEREREREGVRGRKGSGKRMFSYVHHGASRDERGLGLVHISEVAVAANQYPLVE